MKGRIPADLVAFPAPESDMAALVPVRTTELLYAEALSDGASSQLVIPNRAILERRPDPNRHKRLPTAERGETDEPCARVPIRNRAQPVSGRWGIVVARVVGTPLVITGNVAWIGQME